MVLSQPDSMNGTPGTAIISYVFDLAFSKYRSVVFALKEQAINNDDTIMKHDKLVRDMIFLLM